MLAYMLSSLQYVLVSVAKEISLDASPQTVTLDRLSDPLVSGPVFAGIVFVVIFM